MKRFLIGLFLITAGIFALGMYMGWFNFTVDKVKFKEDKAKAVEKVKDLGQQAKDKVMGTEKSKDQATTPVQPTSPGQPDWFFGSSPKQK
jgi:anionic cell wall polymer biosynthesis LytR-Cps2A-Psr (LCP) family protein